MKRQGREGRGGEEEGRFRREARTGGRKKERKGARSAVCLRRGKKMGDKTHLLSTQNSGKIESEGEGGREQSQRTRRRTATIVKNRGGGEGEKFSKTEGGEDVLGEVNVDCEIEGKESAGFGKRVTREAKERSERWGDGKKGSEW